MTNRARRSTSCRIGTRRFSMPAKYLRLCLPALRTVQYVDSSPFYEEPRLTVFTGRLNSMLAFAPVSAVFNGIGYGWGCTILALVTIVVGCPAVRSGYSLMRASLSLTFFACAGTAAVHLWRAHSRHESNCGQGRGEGEVDEREWFAYRIDLLLLLFPDVSTADFSRRPPASKEASVNVILRDYCTFKL